MKHVMVDLETLGKGPDAAVFAIGAVRFDETGTGSTFYRTIDLQSAVDHGGVIEPDTVIWWMEQHDAARQALIDATGDMSDVLADFTQFLNAAALDGLWGNGAAFDNAILAQAYRRQGDNPPWQFYKDRCYRTEKAQSPVKIRKRTGTHHNALDDAITQAEHLINIWKHKAPPAPPTS